MIRNHPITRPRAWFGPVRDRLLTTPSHQRAIEHVVRMGARPTGELVAELLEAAGGDPLAWRSLDGRILRADVGDKFRPTIQPVPSEREDTP